MLDSPKTSTLKNSTLTLIRALRTAEENNSDYTRHEFANALRNTYKDCGEREFTAEMIALHHTYDFNRADRAINLVCRCN